MKKIFAIVVVAMATVFSCVTANAQEVKKESPWVEVQVVDIPFEAVIHEGVTKNGNPKFWFEFSNIGNVTVSPGNAEKFKKQETVLVLVKWENKETGKFKYTTRQKNGRTAKVTPNVDLNTLF
jgi:hypothetical protein